MQPSIENVPYPDWLNNVWAKSAELGEGGQPETLARHTWHVLSRLAEFIRLRPNLPTQLNVPRLWHILFWSAFLHDFGKAVEGFQTQLRPDGQRWGHRHEVFSLAFVDWVAGGLSTEEQQWLVASIVSHHQDFDEIQASYLHPSNPYPQRISLSGATLRGLWNWLSECGIPWRDELRLANFGISRPKLQAQETAIESVQQRGVERIRYWLAGYCRLNEDLEDGYATHAVVPGITVRGYIINADHSASAHAGSIPPVQFDADTILARNKLSQKNLFGHQSQAVQVDGSALLIAPTGSGKTEAALLWAARQSSIIGGLPRLFYTLPYQASMNAMQVRLEKNSPKQEHVGLQHGRSLLALYWLLLEKGYGPKAAARTAKWAQNLSRLNYPPVRVFSPYQMLKGMYRLKGYEALLTDYHNAAFIFDEIHAYEIPRMAMILKTIEYLRMNFNARFFIMSATFPKLIQEWLFEALDTRTKIEADSALFQKFIRHRLILHDGELLTAGLANVISDAKDGKSVLVVCNLVNRAQEAYNQIRDQLDAVNIRTELLHGRFNMRDRSKKEQLIRNATGSTNNECRPIVLVATQVVEVSLDIDLNTIYTELAPLEALIQRFGRINRRRLKDFVPVHVFRQPDDGQKIYDPELIQRTLSILEREHERQIDEGAIGAWLDEIYSGEVEARWRENYQTAAADFDRTCVRTMRPFAANEELEEMFYKAFDGVEVLPEPFYCEYKAVKEEDPIRAEELLVPISLGRFHALRNGGQILPRNRREPYRVNAEYNSEVGLTFA